MDADLSYTLQHEGDSIPVAGNLTLGRHIDNDIVIAGEDVLDFHLRIELNERGPQVIPLGNSNFTVNGQELDHAVGLIVGDLLGIGSETLVIGVERELASTIRGWRLVADESGRTTEIGTDLLVGRHPDSGLQVQSEHVSRRHARLLQVSQALWIQDLGSANGTRVNGKPIIGGCRLLHGDLIQFDEIGFRLHGSGEHLTLVRAFESADLTPLGVHKEGGHQEAVHLESTHQETQREPSFDRSSEEIQPIEPSVRRRAPAIPQLQPGQARLVGLTEHVAGRTWPIPLGRSRLGRGSQCEIRIEHGLLAEIQAEVVARPEHTVITALRADAGLILNGQPLRVGDLGDGDTLQIGELEFRFQQAERPPPEPMVNWTRLTVVVLGVVFLTAVVLAMF